MASENEIRKEIKLLELQIDYLKKTMNNNFTFTKNTKFYSNEKEYETTNSSYRKKMSHAVY